MAGDLRAFGHGRFDLTLMIPVKRMSEASNKFLVMVQPFVNFYVALIPTFHKKIPRIC